MTRGALIACCCLGLTYCGGGDSKPADLGVSTDQQGANEMGSDGARDVMAPDQAITPDLTCECSKGDGPCCDGCNYYTLADSHVCKTEYQYKCEDNACGADAMRNTGTAICEGFTADCTGTVSWTGFEVLEACSADQVCESDNSTSASCKTCPHGCGTGACYPDCKPGDDCCNVDGTACAHGCDAATKQCWPECDPSGACCDADGTACDHGCDSTGAHHAAGTCWPACDPAGSCCAADGTLLTAEFKQPNANLYWARCFLGQTWDAATCTCTGYYQTANWCDAKGASASNCSDGSIAGDNCKTLGSNWRLPTSAEYRALFGGCQAGSGGTYRCSACSNSATCNPYYGQLGYYLWTSDNYDATSGIAVHGNYDASGSWVGPRTHTSATRLLCVHP